MTQDTPPSGFHRGWLAAGCVCVGMLAGYAFHELAGFRPFVPPIISGSTSMACADLDAYVQHVSDLQDHRMHRTTFGIHRQNTVDAVNELYDRARCGAHPIDDLGHEGYQTLSAKIEQDVNDPGPHSSLAVSAPHVASEAPRPYPLYSHGELVSPATAPAPAPTATAGRPARIIGVGRRYIGHSYTTLDDDGVQSLEPKSSSYMAEENQAGMPAGAADPSGTAPTQCPPPVHPGQMYYGPLRRCPGYIRLPN